MPRNSGVEKGFCGVSSTAIQKYDARHAFILLLRAYLGLYQMDCDSVYGLLSKRNAKTSRLFSQLKITANKETFTDRGLGTIRLQMFEVQIEDKKQYLYFAFDLCSKFMWVKVLEQNGQEDTKGFVKYVIDDAPYKIKTIFVGSNLSFLKNNTIVCGAKAPQSKIQYIENALQERNAVGHDLVLSDGSWKISVLEDSEHFLQCTKGAPRGAIINRGYALPDNPEDCKCSDVQKLFAQISEASSYEKSIDDTYNGFASIYNNVELEGIKRRTPNLFILDEYLLFLQSFKANFAELNTTLPPSGNYGTNIVAMLLLEPYSFKTQFGNCRLLYTKPATFLLHAVAMVGQRKYGIQELNNIKDNANYVLNKAEEILECVKHNNQTNTVYDKVIGDLQRHYNDLLKKISEQQSEMPGPSAEVSWEIACVKHNFTLCIGPKDSICEKHGSDPHLDQKAGNSTNGVTLKESGNAADPIRVPSQTSSLSCIDEGADYYDSDSEQFRDVGESITCVFAPIWVPLQVSEVQSPPCSDGKSDCYVISDSDSEQSQDFDEHRNNDERSTVIITARDSLKQSTDKADNSTNGVALKESGSTLAPILVLPQKLNACSLSCSDESTNLDSEQFRDVGERITCVYAPTWFPPQESEVQSPQCSHENSDCYVISDSDSEQPQGVAEKRKKDNNGPYEGASGKKICLSRRQIRIDSAYNVPLDLRVNKCVLLDEDHNRVTSYPTGKQQVDSEGAYVVGCSAAQDVTSENEVSAVGFQKVHPELQQSDLKLVTPSSQEVADVNVVNLVGVRKFHPRILSAASVYDYASPPGTMMCGGVSYPLWTDQLTRSNMHR